jgi:hypothetical protein
MATPEERSGRWADFVREQMDRRGWINQRLVEASGTKANGRPVIDPSRVKAWLEGEAPRDPDTIEATARAFGLKLEVVLAAAGYLPGSTDELAGRRRPVVEVRELMTQLSPEEVGQVLADLPYLDEARREHISNQYDLLRSVPAPARLQRVAKKRPPGRPKKGRQLEAGQGDPFDESDEGR